MKLQFGSNILNSYKRLSYTAWYALAEFVDNSTQAFVNNKAELKAALNAENVPLTVKIEYRTGGETESITIEDNSIGMDLKALQSALTIGLPPENTSGRSRYGLGLKTAAFWFGDVWSIRTKRLGNTIEYFVEISLEDIIRNPSKDLDLIQRENISKDSHYTIIKITQLNRKIYGKTATKVKEYLRSIYRNDFDGIPLKLFVNGEELKWDKAALINRLIKFNDQPLLREFDFEIGGKRVRGWAGVFEKGSRKDAGFSIIQAGRVIKGWPDSYRPGKLFGYQEGGSNDLVNQRLVGELSMDEFEVSHTKDTILFLNDEEEELGDKLLEEIGDLRQTALEYRKSTAKQEKSADLEIHVAIDEVLKEINSEEFRHALHDREVLPEVLIEAANVMVIESVQKKKIKPEINASIGSLKVIVFVDEESSVNDPYLVTRARAAKDEVLIVINKNHPHWAQLNDADAIYHFIRHCIYDGIAEWKAYFKSNSMNPDTIKNIKDYFLRIPFELEKNSVIKNT